MKAGLRYGVEIRAALPADAADVGLLLGQLGAPMDARTAAARLETLARTSDSPVLVATGYGPLAGLIALHWGSVLQHARPVARITALVVDEGQRGAGIGRLLVKAGAQAARSAGCDLLELAAGPRHALGFLRAIGFADDAVQLTRSLRKKPSS